MCTLFDVVQERLAELIPLFGYSHIAQRIQSAYALICRESLDIAPGAQRSEMCRLNRDGTAIQFSLALASGRIAPLQFLGEAGAPGSDDAARAVRSIETMEAVAALIGAVPEFSSVAGLLRQIAPDDPCSLLGRGSGVYWVGVSFSEALIAMTVYINTRFGGDSEQWDRARVFASFFDVSAHGGDAWSRIEGEVRGTMTPLGCAVNVSAGHVPSGRLYLSSYGVPFDFYVNTLPKVAGEPALRDTLDRYITSMIGVERHYPARSVACSFEFDGSARLNTKFEFCPHCAYANDAETAIRSAAWLERVGMDAELYRHTTAILGGALGRETPGLHSFVGVGMRRGEPYYTFYLNPGVGVPPT